MERNRDMILRGLLSDIANISNKEYQKRIWICAEGPECDDFTELVCRFFFKADTFLEESSEYKLPVYKVNILKKFIHEFDKFSEENDLPQLFIDTPEWTKITMMAKEVLKAFDYQK